MAKTKKDADKEQELDLDDKVDGDVTEVADAPEENEVEKRLKELEAQMKKADEDRVSAESERKIAQDRAAKLQKERDEAVEKASKSEGRAALTQKEAIAQALQNNKDSLASHRQNLKLALESGDSDKVVEFQEKLSSATYQVAALEDRKNQFDAWEKQQEEVAKRQPAKQETTPETQAWIDRNPRFLDDSEFQSEATAAHHAAIGRRLRPDSPAYFKFIDDRLDRVFANSDEPEGDDTDENPPARKSAPAAPPNRGAGGNGSGEGNGKKVYKLTAQQREAASFMKMTDLEYAKELERIEQEKGR